MKRPKNRRPSWVPSKARAATIAAVAARLARDLGRPPSDQEIAALLATSEKHVARTRAKLPAGAP